MLKSCQLSACQKEPSYQPSRSSLAVIQEYHSITVTPTPHYHSLPILALILAAELDPIETSTPHAASRLLRVSFQFTCHHNQVDRL